MSWLIDKLRITQREQVVAYAGIMTLAISFISGVITHFSFYDFDPSTRNRALIVSVATPLVLALPFLCLLFSRYLSLTKLSQELKEKEKELAELIYIIPDIVTRSDPSRKLISVNQKYCEIVGHRNEYLIGRDFTEFIHPKSVETVNISLNELSSDHPVSSHQQFHINPDGTERWIYWTNLIRHNLDGEPIEILSVGKDITELHYAELEIKAQAEELEETNKSLEKAYNELEQFTSIASHDLQEPLRKIGFFSEVLANALDEKDDKTVEYALEVLSTSANRSRAQVSNLLTLSRTSNQTLDTTWINVSELLDSVTSDLSLLIEHTQTKVIRGNDDITVRGDWQLTSMILNNLIQNAMKFAHPERSPEIRISFSLSEPDKYVLMIEDNGIGFEDKYGADIFKAFQRLHSSSEYEGTGIGLAIVATAVKRQGWRVYAEGKPDQGATFSIEIPAASSPLQTRSEKQPTTQ